MVTQQGGWQISASDGFRVVSHPLAGSLGCFSCPRQCSKKTRSMQSLEIEVLNWHDSTAATFYWPKQVIIQADSESGEIESTISGRYCTLALQKVSSKEEENWAASVVNLPS